MKWILWVLFGLLAIASITILYVWGWGILGAVYMVVYMATHADTRE